MKKTLLTLMLLFAAATDMQAQNSQYDLNHDNLVNVGDVTTLVNMILGKLEYSSVADLNGDGVLNVGDVTTLVNEILGKTPNPQPTDIAVEVGLCPNMHHPHLIDLGDAGKWACCNVGASNPLEYGSYFAWGETEEKTEYTLDNYTHINNGLWADLGDDISGNAQYDAATAKWGSGWAMPNSKMYQALIEGTTSEWVSIDGVAGRRLTASNGASIFLPAAGCYNSSLLTGAGTDGDYWSATNVERVGRLADGLYFDQSGDLRSLDFMRTEGHTIRPAEYVAPDPAVKAGLCPDEHHPHLIDMGSFGKWACCNVGASNPFEYGSYYAWGETEEKDVYTYDNYTVNYTNDFSGDEQYDVAVAKWGDQWKTPTRDHIMMLLDCPSEWTTINDVNGRVFTASNGNRLFLPAVGTKATIVTNDGTYGLYRSSTMARDEYHVCNLQFNESNVELKSNGSQWTGLPVRPVDKGDSDDAVEAGLCPDLHHPHVIDMGDAGKWACCNVGARTPFQYGGYYAWGEIQEKSDYSEGTYKYIENREYVDLGNISGNIQYDVATYTMLGGWRIPTIDEAMMLAGCTYEWTTLGGVNGGLFTAKNGNRLFLPAAGYRTLTLTENVGVRGTFWTSTLDTYKPRACGFDWNTTSAGGGVYSRTDGHTVRAVTR
ncbi:MAG: dockerin type I repeat-containing protein [Alloprevotella sp.]|nr:dockerin type I repeat-containing protein [Alloprevotella sp.]